MAGAATPIAAAEEKKGVAGAILIVDDDTLFRSVCRSYLEEKGYTVLQAKNGKVAIPQLEERDVQSVFLDILMPDKDGLETLLEIKKGFPGIRVFAMSGAGVKGNFDVLEIAQKFGADGTLRKPFSPRDMVELIEDRQPIRRAWNEQAE